ncbi:Low molecular mass early light-inducible protein HV90, chloroplastic [Tetrabaena socialis]|uniref:Low molecular mass early light-inducible protein HV90, chloroplastic n=1 Tax=Tetrabaena socialis TaxID=47790 RepID=A0A2J7ZR84_9CHLO|nr:Low molecular mass early light-inducible protein HV90, chloroplastic [Tetrabaena socialis]|eukprot:PNH02791.1 Low molecular mass early light-inducible protein HV90, chloroplastic [Tetrabaena socialis]
MAQALAQQTRGCQLLRSRQLRGPAPFSRGVVRVRAEAEPMAAPTAAPLPVPKWTTDKETARDVFSFGGPLPERVNGRLAMIGFVSILGPELAKKQPVLEQMGSTWFAMILFSLLITFASLLPKLVSGNSLADLHAAATGENMKGEGIQAALALFDTNLELWSGRMAMLGMAGLLVIEAVKGESFF